MSDLNHNKNNEHPDFNGISGEEKLQALRDLIDLTDKSPYSASSLYWNGYT